MVKGQINTEAQEAFRKGDVEMSARAHDALKAAEGHTKESGQYIKSIIFGGLDGIITTFAVVAGVAGADLATEVVLVLGFANLVADGISMGFGDYLSSKAEMEYTLTERDREYWELENYPEGEKEEMVEIYIKQGFSPEDAKTVIDIMSKHKDWFVDHMMVHELGLMPPDEDDNPAMTGLVTFLAFILFGFIPLIAYIAVPSDDKEVAFAVACVLTAITLFALGLVKAKVAGIPYLMSALGVLLNGTLAAAAAFFIGWGLGEITQVNESC